MKNDPHFAGLAGQLVHDEIVAARAPWMHCVRAGETLRIETLLRRRPLRLAAGGEQSPVFVDDEDVAVLGSQTEFQSTSVSLGPHLDVSLSGQRADLLAQSTRVRRCLFERGLQARRDLVPDVARGEARDDG